MPPKERAFGVVRLVLAGQGWRQQSLSKEIKSSKNESANNPRGFMARLHDPLPKAHLRGGMR